MLGYPRILVLAAALIASIKALALPGYYVSMAATSAARNLHEIGCTYCTAPFFQVALFFAPNADTKNFVLQTLGHSQILRENYVAANDSLSKALSLKPGDSYSLENRGYALKSTHRYHAAKRDFEGALKSDPKSSYALDSQRHAKHLFEDQQRRMFSAPQNKPSMPGDYFENLIHELNQEVEMYPSNASALGRRGKYLFMRAILDAARLRSDSNRKRQKNLIDAELAAIDEMKNAALTDLDQALLLEPTNISNLRERAIVLNHFKRYTEAKRDIETAISKAECGSDYQDCLGYYSVYTTVLNDSGADYDRIKTLETWRERSCAKADRKDLCQGVFNDMRSNIVIKRASETQSNFRNTRYKNLEPFRKTAWQHCFIARRLKRPTGYWCSI